MKTVDKVSFSVDLKKVIYQAYAESLMANSPLVEPAHLLLAVNDYLTSPLPISQARQLVGGLAPSKSAKISAKVLFFTDGAHRIAGAGAAAGAMTAANILKPALARGDLNVIGATTADEYRQYIEKDAALERRFEPVYVEEPSAEVTLKILAHVAEKLTKHHGVAIAPDSLQAAVDLSSRYITDRILPDKAIDLLDEATSGA